jgi:hypothetical protein
VAKSWESGPDSGGGFGFFADGMVEGECVLGLLVGL